MQYWITEWMRIRSRKHSAMGIEMIQISIGASKSMKSKRNDGMGHWPKGKRRNTVAGWSRTRLGLQRLLDNHYQRGVISIRALAADVGVSDRTVRRWLSGEDVPAAESAELVAAWVAEKRREVKRQARH